MGYAGIGDVEATYGPMTSDQVATATTLIRRAEAQIAQRVPTLAARITAGRTSEELVRQVVAEMVDEVLRNPEGYLTGTKSISNGPFSETESGTRSASAAPGRLVITRRQLGLLGERRGTQSVPNGDPALAHVAVARHERRGPYRGGLGTAPDGGEGYDGYGRTFPDPGFVWPETWTDNP